MGKSSRLQGTVIACLAFLNSIVAVAQGQSSHQNAIQLRLELTLPVDESVFFGSVNDVDAWPNGSLAVLDRQSFAVYVFDQSGSIIDTLGREGRGPGEIKMAFNIAIAPTGEIAAADIGNARTTVWSEEGEYLTSFRIRPGWSSNRHLVWNSAGMHYKTGAFGEAELLLESINHVGDSTPKRLFLPLEDDLMSAGVTCVFCAYTVNQQGHPLVAAQDTIYALYELGSDGSVIQTYSRDNVPAVRRSDEELSQLRAALRRGPAGGGGEGGGRPKEPSQFKVRMLAVAIDGHDRVWVQLNQTDGNGSVFDVFSRDALFLGRVVLPEDIRMLRIAGNQLLASGENELGEPIVLVYQTTM